MRYADDYRNVNFRKKPKLYKVARGEMGVLLAEPYKSEILPHWRFRTPEIADKSARHIYGMFLAYKARSDFVGMDMARKYLQMGYTRSRRYANHASGVKYKRTKSGKPTKQIADYEADRFTGPKAVAANIFRNFWKKVEQDAEYLCVGNGRQR